MNNATRFLALLCLLLLAGRQSHAQFNSMRDQQRRNERFLQQYKKAKEEGKNLKGWWKAEESVFIIFSGPAKFTDRAKYDSLDFITQPSYDSVATGIAKPQLSLGVNANRNHLLARLSGSSILSFSQGVQANILRWKYEPFSGNTFERNSLSLLYAQLGVPLTLDYKMGCDVDFDPGQRLCFAVGGGVMPFGSISFSNLETSQLKFSIAPYLYASFGIYARRCWKIRASFQPGSYTVFDNANENIAGTVKTLNVQGSNIITVGICLMDFSRDWGAGGGYRTSARGSGGGGSGGGRRHRPFESTRMF